MHRRVNRYFALMKPISNPDSTASHIQSGPGWILCASIKSFELLKASTTAPLYQTSDASSLSKPVELLNIWCSFSTASAAPIPCLACIEPVVNPGLFQFASLTNSLLLENSSTSRPLIRSGHSISTCKNQAGHHRIFLICSCYKSFLLSSNFLSLFSCIPESVVRKTYASEQAIPLRIFNSSCYVSQYIQVLWLARYASDRSRS